MANDKIFVSVTINLEVGDEPAFRQVAYQQALKDGLQDAEAREYLDEETKSLGECAAMILDPGMSPDGCSILNSEWS